MSYKEFLDKYSSYPPHGSFYANFKALESAALSREEAYKAFERKLDKGQIKDMAEVDSFIKELEESGTDNIVKAAQEQLDEWRSKH